MGPQRPSSIRYLTLKKCEGCKSFVLRKLTGTADLHFLSCFGISEEDGLYRSEVKAHELGSFLF